MLIIGSWEYAEKSKEGNPSLSVPELTENTFQRFGVIFFCQSLKVHCSGSNCNNNSIAYSHTR